MRLIDIEPILRRKLPLLVMLDEILSAPSIDLVHCGECKCRNEDCGMGEHKWCEKLNMSTTPDDFCLYGERKELVDEEISKR